METTTDSIGTPEVTDVEKLRRTIRRSTAAIVAVLVLGGGVAWKVTRPERWDFQQCFKASLSGSGYTHEDLVDKGCFD